MSLMKNVNADLYRFVGKLSIKLLLKTLVINRQFRTLFLLRVMQSCSVHRGRLKDFFLAILKFFYKVCSASAGMDLSWKTKITPGFCITHGWGLVINPRAIIGKNVTVFHGVTIGQRDKIFDSGQRESSYPVIEDGVWIGPHAIIVGGVVIGEGSIIAAGSFVTESIPPHSLVMGNPSRIVKSNCLPDIVNPV